MFSGTDPRSGGPLCQPARDRQQRRSRHAGVRRLGHLRDARLREDDLHRQRSRCSSRSTRSASARCGCCTDSGGRRAVPRRPGQRGRVRPRARHDAGVLLRRLRPAPAGRACSAAPTARSRPSREDRTATGSRDARSRRSATSSWRRASGFEAWNRAAAATAIRSSAIPRPCRRDVLDGWVTPAAAAGRLRRGPDRAGAGRRAGPRSCWHRDPAVADQIRAGPSLTRNCFLDEPTVTIHWRPG